MKSPALWSLEQRNLYKLVTEVDTGGAVVDRYETTFGIRTCTFDAEKGFFLNGKSVKLKGTCNHQDHAGVGAALPDAVQYFRIRKLQEMGCNALRTSHNPPTPELLDAADELGMLVFDETRMMSSNPEGLAQFENLVRRDRNHPSVFMWSMGNEEGTAATDRGFLILICHESRCPPGTTARGRSPSRPSAAITWASLASPRATCRATTTPTRRLTRSTRPIPQVPVMGTEQVSAVATRGIYVMDPRARLRRLVRPLHHYRPRLLRGLVEFLQRAAVAGGRLHLDGLRLPRRALALRLAEYQLAIRHHRHLRLSQGQLLLLPVVVDCQAGAAPVPALELAGHGRQGDRRLGLLESRPGGTVPATAQSLGAKEMKKDSHLAWNVTYAPGAIEARGFKDGKQVMTAKRETVGAPAKLVLTADRKEISADGEDVAMFAVEVQDAQGRCPDSR